MYSTAMTESRVIIKEERAIELQREHHQTSLDTYIKLQLVDKPAGGKRRTETSFIRNGKSQRDDTYISQLQIHMGTNTALK
jgi:hypothetical protein